MSGVVPTLLYVPFPRQPMYRAQTRSQVLRFGGAKYIFRGTKFLVLLYVKTNFSGHKKILG